MFLSNFDVGFIPIENMSRFDNNYHLIIQFKPFSDIAEFFNIGAKVEKLLRIKDIVGDKSQGISGIIPISKSSWWDGVAKGRFPKPIKLGTRTTCWRESDILALIRGN
jgi:hypothetical protein